MNIYDVRLGHATNSSSSHSAIILPNQRDKMLGYSFGWDYFTAASKESKTTYLGVQLKNALMQSMDEETADIVVRSVLGVEVGPDEHIDHQSVWTLPMSVGESRQNPNWRFFEDLKTYILQENLVILGGNDNTEERERHPLLGKGQLADLPIPRDCDYNLTARYDERYKFWVIYNRETGSKIRFSFDDLDARPERSSVPELIDVKITDFCTSNCSFCYQGSGPTGEHAEENYYLYWALEELGVFEVAIGGGEPTLHPKFNHIVENFHYYGITPNFSTRNLNWFHVPANRALLDKVGGFALSIDEEYQVENFAELLRDYKIEPGKASIQIVDRTMPSYKVKSILRRASKHNLSVTILGFKEVGRGTGFKQSQPQESWLDIAMKLQEKYERPSISVDTSLAREYQGEMEKVKTPSYLYRVKEGESSMYIDMVGMQTGRSSFEPETFAGLDEISAENILSAFESYGEN